MKRIKDKKGVTLIELMITLVIFTVVISMIYSVFNALIKQATSERKTAKTEMDVINVAWPLLKEIQSAGFGTPKYDCSSTTQCACGIAVSGNDLVIHSTAAGNSERDGIWSYIGSSGSSCTVTDMYASTGGNNVVVINSTDKSKVSSSPPPTVNSSNVIVTYDSNYVSNVAYWTPYSEVGDLECYETTYRLYTSTTPPATCATGTQTLGRRVKTVAGATGGTLPMLDCVLGADTSTPADRGFSYRFGCISSAGALTWQPGTDCGTSKLRLVKIGIVVQSSMRRDILSPAQITLFEGLRDSTGASLEVVLDLTTAQRNYKWRKIEQTITLKNLE